MPFHREQKKVLADFGANLRRERTARGITQEKLAELADLNMRTVQKIESGRLNVLNHNRDPASTRSRLRLGQALSCVVDRLLIN